MAKRSQRKTEDSRKHLENKLSLPLSHEAPEFHAVNCVLKDLDANGLGRVLLKGDVGSAAQTLIDPVWVGREERRCAKDRDQ